MTGKKCAEKAKEHRLQGNLNFKNRKFREALLDYNKSICFAPQGSELIPLCYYDRSAVYLEIKLFDLALSSLEKAAAANYLDIEELKMRKLKCLEKINSKKLVEIQIETELTYPVHLEFPFMVDCLELRKNKSGTTSIITKRDLQVGDVIALAEPFSLLIDPKEIYARCSYCLKDNFHDLIPCPKCSNAMFCSEICKSSALEGYHHFECRFDEMPHHATRFLFEALSNCDGDVHALEKLMNQKSYAKHFLLDFDWSNPHSTEALQNRLLVMHSLRRLDSMPSSEVENFLRKFSQLAKENKQTKKIWRKHEDFINSIITRQLRIYSYQKEHEGSCLYTLGSEDLPIGQAFYPLMECFQQNLNPNTKATLNKWNKLEIIVSRKVQAGSVIFTPKTFDETDKDPKTFHDIDELDIYELTRAILMSMFPD